MTEALSSNYWISPTALYITLNALGKPDYIQANCVSGAYILCYIDTIIGYDNGHNYRRWKLTAVPTKFESYDEKYVYVQIPRDFDKTDAMLVYPSEHIDLYGYNEAGTLIGSEDYYYIYLQARISQSGESGTTARVWLDAEGNTSETCTINYGTLSSDAAIQGATIELKELLRKMFLPVAYNAETKEYEEVEDLDKMEAIEAQKDFFSLGGVTAYGDASGGGGGGGGSEYFSGLTDVLAKITEAVTGKVWGVVSNTSGTPEYGWIEGGHEYTKDEIVDLLNGYYALATHNHDGVYQLVGSYATLGTDGKVPSSQLPSYVDDVLEYSSKSAFPTTGESGKIYIALDDNKTYRWSGSAYVEISESLALGETSSTAYAGDKGKANADAIAGIKDGTVVVGKANQLATARSLWGNSFNGTKDINGNITIGVQENGDTFLQIGLVRIVYDSTNNALKVEKSDGTTANFYATGGVSAYGSNSGGGGGGGGYDMLQKWEDYAEGKEHWVVAADLLYALYQASQGFLTASLGYTTSGKNYAIAKDSSGNLYANVPWTDTVYTHPTQTAISKSSTILRGITVNTLGHVTGVDASALTKDELTNLIGSYYALSGHNHDSVYSKLGHTHDTITSLGNGTPSTTDDMSAYGVYTRNFYGKPGNSPETYMAAIGFGSGVSKIEIAGGWADNYTPYLYWRSKSDRDVNSYPWRTWRKIIDSTNIGSQSVSYANSAGTASSCSGNSATATTASKLSTVSKTAWGQTFWTDGGVPTNISGAMSSVTNIDSLIYFDTTNSSVTVQGAFYAKGAVKCGGGSVDIYDSSSMISLINSGGANYIESGNASFTASADLHITGYNNKKVDNLYLNATKTTAYGDFLATGGVTAYTASDRNLKENIEDVDCLQEIETLGGIKQFDYKKSGKHSVGLIAQEVQKSDYKDAVFEKEDKTLAINYLDPRFISLALGGVEQLKKENEELKARVARLESLVEQLINK